MANNKPRKVAGGKGNWYVHQRGAAPVAFGSKTSAQNAAKSLRNAKVSRNYQSPSTYAGQHSVSDSKPGGGCAVLTVALVGGALTALAGVGYGVLLLS